MKLMIVGRVAKKIKSAIDEKQNFRYLNEEIVALNKTQIF